MSSDRAAEFEVQALEGRMMLSAALASAGASAMAYGADGVLHVAYYDTARANLRYTTRAVDGTWSPAVTVDAAAGAGAQLSLAVDSGGRPAIAYYDSARADLKYARLDDRGRWTRVTVDAGGKVGRNPSLAFAAGDFPLISYYAASTQDLRLASFNGRRWYVTTVDSAGSVGQFSSLAISPADGSWAVAYESQSERGIKFAQRRRRSFSVALIDPMAGARGWASKPSLAFDAAGRAVAAYADPASDAVLLTRAARRGWGTETVVSSAGAANDTAVCVDPRTGEARVVYAARGGAIRMASASGTSWSVTTVGSGAYAVAAVDPVTQSLAVRDGGATAQVGASLAAPAHVTATAGAPSGSPARFAHRVDVSWGPVAGASGGYVVDRSDDGGLTWRRAGATSAPGATAYTDYDLLADHAYAYRVRAVAGPVTSAYATAAPARTAALRIIDSTGYYGPATPVGNYAIAPTGYEPFYTTGVLLSDRDPGDGATNLMLPDDDLIRRQVDVAVNIWQAKGLVIDIELGPEQGWYWDPYAPEPGATARAEATAGYMAEVIDRVRYWAGQFGRPDLEVGVFGALPVLYEIRPDDAGPWRQVTDFWAGKDRDGRRDRALTDVIGKLDFLSPILYSEADLDHQIRLAQSYRAEATRLGKPLYTFLFEQYAPDRPTPEGSRADDARWRAALDQAANFSDGVVLWCGRVRPYDPAESWLRQVRALESGARSAPAAPSNLGVAAGMRLTWSDNSDDEAGFVVERRDGDGPWRVVGGTTANVTTWSDPGRLGGYSWYAGQRYAYRVRAFNATADSPTSGAFVVASAGRDAEAVNTAMEYNFRLVEQPSPSMRMLNHAYPGTYVRYDGVEFGDDVTEFIASVGLIEGVRDGRGNWVPFDDVRIEVWIDGMDGTMGVPAGRHLGTLICPTNGQTDEVGNGWYDYVRARLPIPADARPSPGRHDVYLRFAGQGGPTMEWWAFGSDASPAAPTQVEVVAWSDRQFAEATPNQRVDVSFAPGDPDVDYYRIERIDRTDDSIGGGWAEVGRMGADRSDFRVFSDVSYRTGWLAAGSTATRVIDGWTSASAMVLPSGFLWDGAFVGWTLTVLDGTGAGQSATVTAFDAGTRAFTLGGAGLSVAPDGTSHYRLTPPSETIGVVGAGSTSIHLVAPAMDVVGGVRGWTIRITSGAATGQVVTIDHYDPSSRTFVLQGEGLSAVPADGVAFVLVPPDPIRVGHTYAYRVIAVNDQGETASIPSSDATLPDPL